MGSFDLSRSSPIPASGRLIGRARSVGQCAFDVGSCSPGNLLASDGARRSPAAINATLLNRPEESMIDAPAHPTPPHSSCPSPSPPRPPPPKASASPSTVEGQSASRLPSNPPSQPSSPRVLTGRPLPHYRTFCDVYATYPDKPPTVFKVLSQDPAYPDAPTEGVRRVLEHARGVPIPRGRPIDVAGVKAIRMGTTGECWAFVGRRARQAPLTISRPSPPVATNALLERKGERTAFLGAQQRSLPSSPISRRARWAH